MKRYILIVMLCFLTATVTSHAGRFRDFCAKYIFADDPYEGEETIAEARELYSNEAELREFLRGLYYLEINRTKPRASVVKALEKYFGGEKP